MFFLSAHKRFQMRKSKNEDLGNESHCWNNPKSTKTLLIRFIHFVTHQGRGKLLSLPPSSCTVLVHGDVMKTQAWWNCDGSWKELLFWCSKCTQAHRHCRKSDLLFPLCTQTWVVVPATASVHWRLGRQCVTLIGRRMLRSLRTELGFLSTKERKIWIIWFEWPCTRDSFTDLDPL